MDVQYYGGNCVALSYKGVRLIVDDNLTSLGLKSVSKTGDILLYTAAHATPVPPDPKLIIDGPGEFEVANLAIAGIAARAHMDNQGTNAATIYRLLADETSYLFTGNIYPELNDEQLEAIGMIDVMFVPVGGNGYTLDAGGALQLIKAIEPKVVIPLHYNDPSIHYPVAQQGLEQLLKNLSMEPSQTVSKFRFKPADVRDTTQLVILSRS